MIRNNFGGLTKVMYLAPRYHANLVGSVEALRNAGFEVQILSAYRGQTPTFPKWRAV